MELGEATEKKQPVSKNVDLTIDDPAVAEGLNENGLVDCASRKKAGSVADVASVDADAPDQRF